MKNHRSLVLGALVLGVPVATGCAPRLTQLVEQKHYREALCAAVAEDREDEVADALADDADVHLHVHRVRHEELERVIGFRNASRVDERAEFVRVRFQSNAIPVDGYGIKVWLEGQSVGNIQAAPVDWGSLAYATDEKLPPNVPGTRYNTGENFLIGAAAVFTAGFSFLFTGWFKPQPTLVQAPRSAFLQHAPLATALHEEMAGEIPCAPFRSDTHQSRDCALYFVLQRQGNIDWSIRVEQAFAANRLTVPKYSDDAVCRVEHSETFVIGDAAQTEALFAGRMTALSDLSR